MLMLNSSFSSLGDCNDCTMIILFHNYSEIYSFFLQNIKEKLFKQ